MSQFWILAIIAAAGCIIMFGIDYSNSEKDKKSKNALLLGYGVVLAGALVAIWGLNQINPVIIYGAAILALVFFGRYLIRKAANRKQ